MVPKTSSGRWLAGIAIGVALLAMASIALTLVAGDEVEDLPEGSPERAVQDYLLAIQDREYAAAYALLAPERQEDCTLQDYEQSFGFRDDFSVRVRLDEVTITSTGAHVSVQITETYSPSPQLFPNENSFTSQYFLTQVDGSWRLLEVGWPYGGCSRFPRPAATPTPTPTPTPTSTPPTAAPEA